MGQCWATCPKLAAGKRPEEVEIMQHNRFWKPETKAVFSMRSYLTTLSLVLVMSGVASAQQEFRSFAPGLSPMMPVAGPEMSNDKETDAQNDVADGIVQEEVPRIDRGYALTENVTGQDVRVWIDSGSGLKAEGTIAAKIVPNAPVTVTKQPPVTCGPACQNPANRPRNFTR
jgi:hypothetical protein